MEPADLELDSAPPWTARATLFCVLNVVDGVVYRGSWQKIEQPVSNTILRD